jgi:hypothetical protein
MPRFPRRLAAVLALTLGAAVACDRPTAPLMGDPPRLAAASTTNPVVEVDFAAPLPGVRPVNGLLHGMSASRMPHDTMIVPLRPALWRIGTFDLLPRVNWSRARPMLVLSDLWGYPKYGGGTVKWPYDDYAYWERFVDSVAVAHAGKDVIWDVWNEPDIDFFWPQTDGAQARFHETYARAVRVLRARLGPQAVVSGPSYSQYFPDRIAAFVEYCQANGCEANVLSWHELNPAHTLHIAEHLREARQLYITSGVYPDVQIRELHVTEAVGRADTHRPGAAIVSMFQLEQGGADAAARACWEDASGELTCFNDSLDGLLTSSGRRRRASWWAYKGYADGVGTRVTTRISDARLVGLASSQSGTAPRAQLLMGFWSPDGAPSSVVARIRFTNLSRVPFLAGRTRVRVRAHRIPNSGEAAVDRLATALERQYAVAGDAVTFDLGIGMYEGHLITIE